MLKKSVEIKQDRQLASTLSSLAVEKKYSE